MTKIRTLTQFQEVLDREMAWRVREIAAFKLATKADGVDRQVFLRAGVALVYAHWEGFIKASSEAYLNFVNNQNHAYRELKSCFAVFGLKGKLALLSSSRQAQPNIEAFEFILGELDNPARMSMSNAIDTESNLTSRVFANIASSLDIATTNYETKFHLIDQSLVKRRNKVAHGEYIDFDVQDFRMLADDMLQMMRSYKIDLQNAASMASYRRPTPSVRTQASD